MLVSYLITLFRCMENNQQLALRFLFDIFYIFVGVFEYFSEPFFYKLRSIELTGWFRSMCWILQDDSVVHQWKIRVTAKCRDKNFVFLCIFKLKLEIYNGNCAEENGTKTSITKTKMLHNYLVKKAEFIAQRHKRFNSFNSRWNSWWAMVL